MILLATIFAIVHGPTGDYPATFDGMSQARITQMMTASGKTVDFVTKAEYNAYVRANQPKPVLNAIKEQARLDLKDKSKTSAQRLDALITYLDLDQ